MKRSAISTASFLIVAGFAWAAGARDAAALTQEAAIESCRERIGKPRVMACVQNMVRTRGGPGQQYIETCRAPVKPLVQACVRAALMKANARPDVPLALGTKKEEVSTERALKAGFVVPPRTISDITAILSNEKPDAARLAERQAMASEAASGLGRSFFYAGTRAHLVTNRSVHSQSARELVTNLFARQADDGALNGGEALRRAMTAMVDHAGYKNDAGEMEFAYAHPLFWASYTIIGDAGGL